MTKRCSERKKDKQKEFEVLGKRVKDQSSKLNYPGYANDLNEVKATETLAQQELIALEALEAILAAWGEKPFTFENIRHLYGESPKLGEFEKHADIFVRAPAESMPLVAATRRTNPFNRQWCPHDARFYVSSPCRSM